MLLRHSWWEWGPASMRENNRGGARFFLSLFFDSLGIGLSVRELEKAVELLRKLTDYLGG